MDEEKKVTRSVVIKHELGLNARNSALFVMAAAKTESQILVSRKDSPDFTVNARSIMGLLMLACPRGTEIEITVTGDDAEFVAGKFVKIVEENFSKLD